VCKRHLADARQTMQEPGVGKAVTVAQPLLSQIALPWI